MAIADLANVLKIFGGGEPTAEEIKDLYKEVALITLGQAASADTNTQVVEVNTVQKALKDLTGEEFSTADIRLAGTGLFQKQPLEKILTRASGKLDAGQRMAIVNALADVIHSDARISPKEVVYFNRITKALQLTHAEMAGLKPDHP